MIQEKGSITVFLTFILLLILALIGTMIDVSRVQVAQSYAYRGLVDGMEAEFSKYCSELYEDYHLFMRERKIDSEQLSGDAFAESVKEYMLYGFQPSGNSVNSIDVSIDSCKATEITGILDYDSELVQSQIVDYMKYQVASDKLGNLFEQMKLLEESQNTIKVVQKKTRLEESIGEVDKKILRLIEEVDGISFEGNSFAINASLEVKVKDSFAKKFCVKKIRAGNVGISINVLWDALRNKYINPVTVMEDMLDYYEREIGICTTKEERLNKMNSKEFKSIVDQYEKVIKEVPGVISHIDQAITLINEIEQDRKSSQSEVDTFSSYLNSEENNLNRETYKGMQEECEQLKKYTKGENIIKDTAKMKECLQNNREILEGQSSMSQLLQQCSLGEWEEFHEFLLKQIECYKTYSIEPLKLNYSTLQVGEKAENPIATFTSAIKGGIASFVLDDSMKLSKEEVIDNDLSSNYCEKKSEYQREENLDELIGQVTQQGNLEKEEGKNANLTNDESSRSNQKEKNNNFNLELGEKISLHKGTEDTAKKLLLIQYGITEFRKYESEDTQNKGKIQKREESENIEERQETEGKQQVATKLLYEQEYLVAGKRTDSENIQSVIKRTIFIRTVMNYLSLLSDSKSRKEAEVAAVGIIGFTGLQPVVSAMKQLILITWSIEEAMVDMRALVLGKEIVFLKQASDFSISLKEMLLFSKEFIQQKAEKRTEEKTPFSMGYEDYIKCYLLLQDNEVITYRMLDLIQMNMRVRYKQTFSFQQGIFGMTMKVNIVVPGKMLHLPFVKTFSGYDGAARTVEVVAGYSY